MKRIHRTYYLFTGRTKFQIKFRGMKMEVSANRKPIPTRDLRVFADWVLDCVDEIRIEAGLTNGPRSGP
jgi:hypothetical protein